MADAIADPSRWANFQKWSANTVLTLVNVPWNNDYRDIHGFATQADLDAYIDSKPNAGITKFSLNKFGTDVQIDTPINAAMRFNYLRAVNPVMPIDGDVQRTYYYFINGVEYLNPRTTRLRLQLDVWATFFADVQFGRCLVERGHVGIANSNQFEQYGRSYLTVPEGLDTGNEYRVVHVETELFDTNASDTDLNVLVCSTIDLTQDPGSVGNPALSPSPPGTIFNGLPSGAAFYVFDTTSDFQAFLRAYAQYPWLTEAIISMTLVPITRFYPSFAFDDAHNVSPVTGVKFYYGPVSRMSVNSVSVLTNWRNQAFITNILGPAYSSLKKFFTAPYMAIELTTWTGSPLLIKPEAWQDPDAKVIERAAFIPPGQRIAIAPYRYNGDDEQPDTTPLGTNASLGRDDGAENMDFAAILDNFPTLPLVNNMALGYLAANRNGIAFSYQNAGWGRERAIAGAQAGADVANAQIGNTQRQQQIANAVASQGQVIQNNLAALGGISRVVTGAMRGDAAGMLQSTADATLTQQGSLANVTNQNQGRAASAGSDVQTAGQIRDTNQDYANFAANGDYANQVKGINARVQDAMLTQPSTSGQFGGDAFNIANYMWGYSLRWKMPNLQQLRQIGNYWLRYGYAVQQYMTPPASLHCMTKFTYWKFLDSYLLTTRTENGVDVGIPEGFKQIIRGIFEKGVTIWVNPDDIPTLDLSDNAPLDGISY